MVQAAAALGTGEIGNKTPLLLPDPPSEKTPASEAKELARKEKFWQAASEVAFIAISLIIGTGLLLAEFLFLPIIFSPILILGCPPAFAVMILLPIGISLLIGNGVRVQMLEWSRECRKQRLKLEKAAKKFTEKAELSESQVVIPETPNSSQDKTQEDGAIKAGWENLSVENHFQALLDYFQREISDQLSREKTVENRIDGFGCSKLERAHSSGVFPLRGTT